MLCVLPRDTRLRLGSTASLKFEAESFGQLLVRDVRRDVHEWLAWNRTQFSSELCVIVLFPPLSLDLYLVRHASYSGHFAWTGLGKRLRVEFWPHSGQRSLDCLLSSHCVLASVLEVHGVLL